MPASFNALSDNLLELIFACVCTAEVPNPAVAVAASPAYLHRGCIPLVCQRWRRVYTESTLLWERLSIDWADTMQNWVLAAPPEEHIRR